MAELDQIRWRCRRGLLELDLILERFNERHLGSLDADQLERFNELLALYDNDLLALVKGRVAAPDPSYNYVLQLLRSR